MIINPSSGGISLPRLDNPGTAADLLEGKQLVDQDGNPLTGTMPQRSAGDLTASGAEVTVPAGYYPEQTSRSVAAAAQATPSISVSSSGLITATHTQTAGYVAAGTKSATKQMTTQAAKTWTPTTTNQTIASGRYLTGTQTIKGDANLKAANIKSGVSIFGVAGNYKGDIEFCTVRIVNNLSYATSYWGCTVGRVDASGIWFSILSAGNTAALNVPVNSLIVIQGNYSYSYSISGSAVCVDNLTPDNRTRIFGVYGDCTITIR